jgi:hypothetical protein
MLVIVPSRGRPGNIRHLIDSWQATDAHATLVVAVDNDDPTLESYQKIDEHTTDQFQLVVGPRLRMAGTLNAVAMSRIMRAGTLDTDIIGFMGDDHRPRTTQWDATVEDVFRQWPHCVVYGNDLLQGMNLPTQVFMSAGIIKTLGYMVPPGFTHLFLDNTWKAWGQSMNRLVYLHDTVIEHMHPVAGKSAWDARYEEVNAGQMYADDEVAFKRYVAGSLHDDAEKLRSLISG